PLARGHDHARVHMNRWHVRVLRMRDQRNAAGPIARVFLGSWNLLAEFRRELAMDRRDMHADLFEDAAMHDRHDAAAALAVILLPGRADEASGLAIRKRPLQFIFKLFVACADAIAQFLEPGLSRLLLLFDVCRDNGRNLFALHSRVLPARSGGVRRSRATKVGAHPEKCETVFG